MVVSVISNSSVIYSITKLKLTKKPSIRLLLLLFISNIAVSIFSMPLSVIVLEHYENCFCVNAADFFHAALGHFTVYVMGLIGYDRFLRIKYLNEYTRIVTSKKMYTALIIVLVLSFTHGGTYIIVNKYYETVDNINVVINGFLYILLLLPYLLLIKSIRDRRRGAANPHMFAQVDRTVTNIALRIMVAVMQEPCTLGTAVRGPRIMGEQWY